MVANSRVLSDDYTASGQLAWSQGHRGPSAGESWWREGFLGQLRFDSLFNETLVIPDTHIIDGVFFLQRGPSVLLSALGRAFERGDTAALPLEVRTRGDDLESSIADFLIRYNEDGSVQEHLNGFYFKAISDPVARRQLAAAIRTRTPHDLEGWHRRTHGDVVEGVIGLLNECFSDTDYATEADGWLGLLRNGWRLWLEESGSCGLRTQQWEGVYMPRAATLAEPLQEGRITTAIATETLHEVLARLNESPWRNDANPTVDDALAAARGDAVAEEEIAAIDWWLSRGRYRAIAWQHKCDCLHVDRPQVRRLGIIADVLRALDEWSDGERTVELPDDVVAQLGRLDDNAYSQLLLDQRDAIVAFWRTRRQEHLKPIADAVDRVLPRSGHFGLELRDGLTITGAAGTVAALKDLVTGQMGTGLIADAVTAMTAALTTFVVLQSRAGQVVSRRSHRLLERATDAFALR